MHKIKVNIVVVSKPNSGITYWGKRIGQYLSKDIEIIYTNDNATIEPVDLVHYMIYKRFKPTKVPNISFFTHIEDNMQGMREKFFSVAKQTNYCVVMCKKYYNELVHYGIPKKKISIIPLGLDPELFVPKIKIGICAHKSRTLRKGEEFLEQLFKIADLKYFKFIFVGNHWEDKDNYIAKYKQAGVDIDYLGRISQEELVKFFQDIDYLLVPSSYEGGPLPLIEAMACAKPVISRRVGWATEFKDITFFDDVNDLVWILHNLVNKKRGQVEKITWQNWSKKHEKLYRGLICGH